MAALLFRRHLLGQALFLGNFDRLNSFLNVLQVQVSGWQTHTFGAWDYSMFMGRPHIIFYETFAETNTAHSLARRYMSFARCRRSR
jgi:hypothetical protein